MARGATTRGRAGSTAAGVGGGTLGVTLAGGVQGRGVGPGGVPGPPPIFKQEVRIVADEITNSLVILAVKQDYEMIVDILKKLDVVPRQVVIEVMIAEVTLSKGLEFGIDHAIREGTIFGSDLTGISAVRNIPAGVAATGDAMGGDDTTGDLGDAVAALADPGRGGLAAFISDEGKFAILLRALASRSLLKVLSAPHIIAADNREAHILVGNSIPILSSTSTSVLTATNTVVNQVQYRDVGTILTILPQVNSAGLVNMQIRQEASTVAEDAFGNTNSPSFQTREAETTLVVQSGDSILIGGIIDDLRTNVRRGVPYVMDIPVIGRLFAFESSGLRRTELIILITPHVIRSRDEALSVTDDFKRNIFGLERNLRRQKRGAGYQTGEEPGDERPADGL
jgi:general secretion pathway protein D